MNSAKKEKRSFDKLRTSGEKVIIAHAALAAMRAAARAAYPGEACGLLLGAGGRIAGFRETANVHANPHTHFEIDPQALIDAHRAARAGGAEVIGYFHSHPDGPPEPSATDRALAAGDGRVWAIAGTSAGAHDVRFWRDAEAGFEALSYGLVER